MAQEAVVHPNDSNNDCEERIVTAVSTEAAAADCSVNLQMSFLPTGGTNASQRRQVRRSVERNASSVLGLAADDDEHVTWRPPTPSTPADETTAEQGSVGSSSRWWSWLLYMTARGGHDNNGQKKHVSGECAVLDEVLGVDESLLLSDESQHAQKAPPPAAFQSDYQIMTSNHHSSSTLLLHSRHDTTTTTHSTHSTLMKPNSNNNNSLPPDTLLQRCNFFYNGFHLDGDDTTTHHNEDVLTTTPIWAAYTNHHHHQSPPPQQHSTNNDTKSCLETTNGENTLASLTNAVSIRIPRDNVRLVVMDHRLEPGILSVNYSNRNGALERQRSYHPSDNDHAMKNDNMKRRDMINDDCDEEYKIKSVQKKEDVSSLLVRCRYCQKCQPYPSRRPSSSSPPLNYVLTIEQDLYRRVVKEIADEAFVPMGLYHCCRDDHEDHRVSIGVAIWILGIVFGGMLLITLLWPLN